jgi:ABC-type nitrate/sulfonate/bicarbonate transport systems, periplasmic components
MVARCRDRDVGALLAALMVFVAVLAGCGTAAPSTDPQGRKVTEIRVSYYPLASAMPVYLADQKGIFARNGLHVALTETEDLPTAAAALAQGQYEIAMSVPTIVLVGVSRGLDLQVISRLSRSSAAQPGAG